MQTGNIKTLYLDTPEPTNRVEMVGKIIFDVISKGVRLIVGAVNLEGAMTDVHDGGLGFTYSHYLPRGCILKLKPLNTDIGVLGKVAYSRYLKEKLYQIGIQYVKEYKGEFK